jgi:D-glycero-alpha-D-manno-heptose 1-phosphate guanylyltransferase
MENFDRYGAVELNEDNSIAHFNEKQFYKSGLINGGVYLLNTEQFIHEELPEKFSFEKDYLEKYFATRKIFGSVQDDYFIDIGIPEDYYRVQQDLKQPAMNLSVIDSSWTLFLDRDGVINEQKEGDYIRHVGEFVFYPGVKEAMKMFAERFGKIIVVSNQRGVGRGLMTEDDLTDIHRHMTSEIVGGGGRIDAIYYCTAVDATDPDRKPNPGMAFIAAKDFPDIDLKKSVIAGNKHSDMLFGKNAGMYSVFIASTHPELPFPHPDVDDRFSSLIDFAKAL